MTDPSVRFFVRVAADEFNLDNDIAFISWAELDTTSAPHDLTGRARIQIAHHVIEPGPIEARRADVGTTTADRFLGFRVGTPQLTRRTHVDAGTAKSAIIRLHIEWAAQTAILTAPAETYGLGHHLLFTHTDTQAALNTILVLLTKTLLPHVVCSGEILNCL
ncbi:MAG: hypothetical protein AMS18_02660 [Gemmatimonas sp. SG8_17]|nr:MAG: hypothetical protein AMS18_02660 [Gemmatimonas sp. SG8_17]